MSTNPHHIPLGTIAVSTASGALIAVQSRANGELSTLLGDPREAALVSFGSGLIVLTVFALFSSRLRRGLAAILAAARDGRLPRWQLFAGMMGAFFVIVQAFAVPHTGVAIFSVATIAGQSALSLLVDRLGIRAGVRHHITPRRVVTAAVTVVAVAVSVSDRLEGSFGWVSLLALAAGGIVAVQRAINAHITDYAEGPEATTWLNFATGVLFLVVANAGFGAQPLAPLPGLSHSIFIYSGGIIGVLYIAISSVLVQRLGVLLFTATSVGGQLVGSLGIDLATGVHLAGTVYAGVVLSFAGILVGVARRRVTT